MRGSALPHERTSEVQNQERKTKRKAIFCQWHGKNLRYFIRFCKQRALNRKQLTKEKILKKKKHCSRNNNELSTKSVYLFYIIAYVLAVSLQFKD